MANLFDDWDEAHRAPEPVEVARKSAGELTVDVLTAREEFRESARRIEEGQTLSGLGLGAFTAATFVFPWGRGGRLAMGGALGLRGGRAAQGPALRAARGLGDDAFEGLAGGSGTRRSLPESLLRAEGGSFEPDLSGAQVQDLAESLVQRHLDSPSPLTVMSGDEITAVLGELPEFRSFLSLYDELVSGQKTASRFLKPRVPVEDSALLQFARRTGMGSPDALPGSSTTDESFVSAAMGARESEEAVRAAAQNLGARIRNLSVFMTDDVYSPQYYIEFGRIIDEVSAATGLSPEILSGALASASAKADPYDEMLRILRVAPFLSVKNGRATFPTVDDIRALGPGNHPLWRAGSKNPDTFAITAGLGLAELINNPNFLSYKVPGLAAKTVPYAYLRLDPHFGAAYVSDTVDGVGQFLIKGGSIDTTEYTSAVANQMAGRILADMYGVPPSYVQEAVWSHIRIARDGFLRPRADGNWSPTSIAPAFTGSRGSAVEVLTSAVSAIDPDVLALARANSDEFYRLVRNGEAAEWVWDLGRQRPLVRGAEFLIPPAQRWTPKLPQRAERLQRASLEAVEAAGQALSRRTFALGAALGTPTGLLAASMGAAGAVLGAGQGVAEASEGETLTLAAGPAGSSIAVGATMGAAVGGSFGILAAQALRAARSVRGFVTRKAINQDFQVPLERENIIFDDTLDSYRSQFINRTSGTRQNWEAMPGTEDLPFLGDAPIGRLGKDYYEAIESVQWYMHGAQGNTGNFKKAINNTDVAVPFDLIQDNGPAFASFVDGVLIRAFNGGPGGNVVFDAMGSGAVLNGGALRGKYVVANVTDDFIDPVTYTFRDETIASPEGRRRILQGFRKMYADLGTGIQDDPRGVIYAYNTDDPSYLGIFEFNRKNVFGKETPDVFGPDVTLPGYNDARELVFMGGTLADSQEEAFRLAAQRGQLFVKDAATGRNVRVPDSYVGEPAQLDRITIPPSTRGKNIADQLDVKYDGDATTFYAGRGTADDVLDEIYKLQGFDKPTILVNDAEAQILIRDHGYLPLYRGIEFEGLIDGKNTDLLRDEILNSAVWRNEIAPRITSETEARNYIRQIIDAKKYYEAKYQNDVMDAWLNQNVLVSQWKDFPGLLSDIAVMQNSYTMPRAIGAEWAEKIWGPLAKPENAFVPDQMINELAFGKYFPGAGSHGNGTYTTPNLQRAMGYGGIGTYDDLDMAKNGFVYGVLLKPDARIMGPAEYDSLVRALRFWPDQVGYEDIGNKLASSPWGDELSKLFRIEEIDPGVFEYVLRDSFSDIGRAIAAIGYDGYIPYGTVYGYQKPEYVLLNRQAFVVVNHPIQPVTVDLFGSSNYDVSTFRGYPMVEVPLQ